MHVRFFSCVKFSSEESKSAALMESFSLHMQATANTEKSFRNLIKSDRNQIVFTIFRMIWNQTAVRTWFQINRKRVNTIRFRFDLIRFRKYFSVCSSEQAKKKYYHTLTKIVGLRTGAFHRGANVWGAFHPEP